MSYRRTLKKSKTDTFTGTKAIVTLREEVFNNYLSDQEVAFVMFYDPKGAPSQITKPHFIKAAKTAKKSNAVFAAVNCEDEKNLCQTELIKELPVFRLYSRGRVVRDQNPLNDYKQILKVVEEAPIFPAKQQLSKTVFKG